ncbi:unnamed protein product [Lactuca virosa]|uniref:Ubiquitin receptor RAD23 n=1 Tax=Lactuca virosa TaxID=75947 RepID=A0AAU9NPJ7_9ASTR|nr:unnamed protein product [Lactuca virosa]
MKMKVFVKTLKGTHFEIEVKLEDTVDDVKKNIESVQGSDVYPAAQQMLIHQGKVLEDSTTMEENKVSENSFMVIMLSKNKSSAADPLPTPVAAAAPPPQPPSSTTNTNPPPSEILYNEAASHMVEGINVPGTIHRILQMGGGSWDRITVVRALHAAFNNPERAVEYLYSGIPDSPDLPLVAGAGAPPPPAVNPPPPTGSNANSLNLFPQGLPGGAGAGGNLDFLRDCPNFQALRSRVLADPQILQPMLQELRSQNPELAGLLHERQADIISMIFESVEGGEDELGWGHPASGVSESFTLTSENMDAIDRLEAMGFNRSVVCDVFLACDKSEEVVANYLLDHMNEFEH